MEGVGITFLEETFSASTAPPKHRFHQKAARAVLKALLPEAGADIKGHMRSSADLLDASGYASRPRDFSDLIRILDSEIRLITPTDPDGAGDDGDDPVKAAGGQKYYQLTHDYLVHSLREWLTRKQKETRRGRAELRLAERAATWFARRENRQLPSLWEYIHIRLLTDKKRWTAQERKMVRKAGKVHLTRSSLGVLSLALVAAIGLSIWGQIQQDREKDHAASLVQQLTSAEIGMVPEIAGAIAQQRRWADPLLNREFEAAPFGSVQKLHAALALLPVDSDGSKSLYLREQLLAVTSGQFPVVRDALQPYREAIIEPLWSVALDMPSDSRASFQAACALATFAPQDSRWSQINRPVVDHLLALEASELVAWRTALEPAWKQLMQPLAAVYRSTTEREQARMYAAETLAEYAADDPDALFDLLADADQFQFPKIYGKLAGHRERVAELGIRELARQPVAEADETEKEQGGRRRANVAIALARIGAAEHVWAMLKHSPDSRARSNFIQWLSPLGGDAQTILRRFNEEHDVSIRRALLLALGEFSEKQLPVAERAAFVEKLYTLYENDPDPGLHAAAEWLLRMWNQEAWLKQKNETWAAASQATGEGSARIDPAAKPPAPKKLWYVNSQGQTFVILAAADIQMGSPLSDPDRELDEVPHVRRIGRTLAIASKEVTKSEYRRFLEANPNVPRPDFEKYCPYDDSPQVLVSWYDAARYCNWLSKMDGLPEDQWCYEANEKGEFAEGMRPAADFLVRTGYRLPTEAEWEFACRAGTVNSRHYGADASLLKRYAWFVENSPKAHAMRIGLLKPNDFGLFDMLGNVLEWCHDAYGKYPLADNGGAVNDAAATNTIEEKNDRVLRGGSFTYVASLIRSSVRVSYRPGALAYSVGMRPARTYRGAP
jgi:formylglycine-generating enzyme required for sulfatase activity